MGNSSAAKQEKGNLDVKDVKETSREGNFAGQQIAKEQQAAKLREKRPSFVDAETSAEAMLLSEENALPPVPSNASIEKAEKEGES
eukprot:CAMPEP_0184529950 /NCGR_PEP_ID=MMETSP0198_2-20121128/12677_1 /TAXON_ID=1112570 /ORGANISM="Thraustochytrium sp., Strain LLF1b" /LENGTH=85 /DNA_ID=CAMNT_0026922055 /DNA_START=101 /DNA_END=358 /DNA_ORIENTATION=-